MRVGTSAKPSGPNHGFRKDDDFTRNGSNNGGGSAPVTPVVIESTGRRFDIGPNYQLFSDYSYISRYRSNTWLKNLSCLNCVYPLVNYSGISSYNSMVGEKVMALTNTTEDTLYVEVAFIDIQLNPTNSLNSNPEGAIYKTAILVPGQTYYFLQYEEQFRIDVYANEKSEENLINQYSGNCSPANIYLSLTADQPK
jgi:hypothetical protein